MRTHDDQGAIAIKGRDRSERFELAACRSRRSHRDVQWRRCELRCRGSGRVRMRRRPPEWGQTHSDDPKKASVRPSVPSFMMTTPAAPADRAGPELVKVRKAAADAGSCRPSGKRTSRTGGTRSSKKGNSNSSK